MIACLWFTRWCHSPVLLDQTGAATAGPFCDIAVTRRTTTMHSTSTSAHVSVATHAIPAALPVAAASRLPPPHAFVMEELKLPPERARELTSAGATLLLLDVPPLSQLGFDYLTFTTAELFRGIKMIPPGPHLLHYNPPPSASSPSSPSSPPSYQWLFLHPAQISSLRLHLTTCSLEPLSPDSAHRHALGVANWDFDRGLGPYQLGRWDTWTALCGRITEALLDELEGERRRTEREWESAWTLEDKKSAAQQGDARRGKGQSTAERAGRQTTTGAEAVSRRKERAALAEAYTSIYTAVPDIVIPPGASPSDITALHLDRSHQLSALLSTLTARYASSAAGAFSLLLAELQHAFVSFFIAQHPPAFSHYRHLVHLLSLCPSYLTSHSADLCALLSTLRPQLAELPEDLLVDDLSSDNLWASVIDSLEEMTEEVGGGAALEMRAVRQLMQQRFGWQPRPRALPGSDEGADEEDEYAPVVVRLGEEDAAM